MPNTQKYKAWFDAVRAGVIHYINESEQTAAENVPHQPIGTDTTGHHAPVTGEYIPTGDGGNASAAPVSDTTADSPTNQDTD